jgi:hypothetical protein
LCNGASGASSSSCAISASSTTAGPVQLLTAVHHPVPDGHQAEAVEALAGLDEQVERGAQRRLVVGDPALAPDLPFPQGQRRRRGLLVDPLDDAARRRNTGIGLDELVFQ